MKALFLLFVMAAAVSSAGTAMADQTLTGSCLIAAQKAVKAELRNTGYKFSIWDGIQSAEGVDAFDLLMKVDEECLWGGTVEITPLQSTAEAISSCKINSAKVTGNPDCG